MVDQTLLSQVQERFSLRRLPIFGEQDMSKVKEVKEYPDSYEKLAQILQKNGDSFCLDKLQFTAI